MGVWSTHSASGPLPLHYFTRPGFVFNSPWVVYCSFPLRRDTDDSSLNDRSLARSVQPWQWQEASRYNEDDDSDDEADG